MKCPCSSDRTFESCCEPYLKGDAYPETAEQLMRSRYTAYTRADIDYIQKTLIPESREGFDYLAAVEWAKKSTWKGLQILSTSQGGLEDKKGVVEFIASYEQDGETTEHREISKFRRNSKGHWQFVDGESRTNKPPAITRSSPKVGRNESCPCGSGKKYKKCCEAVA